MLLTIEQVKEENHTQEDLWQSYLACIRSVSSFHDKGMMEAAAICLHNATVYFEVFRA